MIQKMALRNYSSSIIKKYVNAVKGLAAYYHRSPGQLSNDRVIEYLYHELKDKSLTADTVRGKVAGTRYFYRHVLGRPTMTSPRRAGRAERHDLCYRVSANKKTGAHGPGRRVCFPLLSVRLIASLPARCSLPYCPRS